MLAKPLETVNEATFEESEIVQEGRSSEGE